MVSGGFELHAEAPADEVGRKAHERHERHTDETSHMAKKRTRSIKKTRGGRNGHTPPALPKPSTHVIVSAEVAASLAGVDGAFASSFRLPGVGLKWPELQMRSASSMFLKVPAYDDDGIDHESHRASGAACWCCTVRASDKCRDDFGLVLVYLLSIPALYGNLPRHTTTRHSHPRLTTLL